MYKHLFGPIRSRRLGVSLGVDLVTHKICSLDCVYCECGKTTHLTLERKEYVPYNDVIKELEHYFANHPTPDYVTFSGSGEPTLNIRIGDVIKYIKSRDWSSNSPSDKAKVSVAVLTNGTLLSDKALRDELLLADLVVPSLDAATVSSFRRINRPHKWIDLDAYIQGIVDFRALYKGNLALEILILPGFNESKADLDALKDACCKINPDSIQLNTLDRPGTVANLTPASRQMLEEIRAFLQSDDRLKSVQIDIVASSANPASSNETKRYRDDMESAILEIIYRRPCTLKDLASILGSKKEEIERYLINLEKGGKIASTVQQRGVFYHTHTNL
ncbi:MAG: radical SAM protein [Desulfamplus sp.]|nr:radical SAM protein [Desulfamplus sp.]MBF0388750.1 radical SAM protein [Desulfamplus sp.]